MPKGDKINEGIDLLRMFLLYRKNFIIYIYIYIYTWVERWLKFPDLWSGLKTWWNWYLTPVVNFGEVRRAQLAKSTLLASTLLPLGSFRSFKICSGAKGRMRCGKQRKVTASIQCLVKLRSWFLSLRWKSCLWAELKRRLLCFHLSVHKMCNVLTINYSAEFCCGWFCKSIFS